MIRIRNRFSGNLIKEVGTLIMADLRWANLIEADLSGLDFRGANLNGANLRRAVLTGANLKGANLKGADLSEVAGLNYAQIAFAGHGERGRQLLAVEIEGEVMFYCGCFEGTEAQLRRYIEKGEEELKASRIFALETCLKALEFQSNF